MTSIPTNANLFSIKKELSDKLERGKVDFNIYVESLGDESNSKINEPILKSYFKQLSKISADLNLPTDLTTLQAALRLPDVVKTEYQTLNEEEWEKQEEQDKNIDFTYIYQGKRGVTYENKKAKEEEQELRNNQFFHEENEEE